MTDSEKNLLSEENSTPCEVAEEATLTTVEAAAEEAPQEANNEEDVKAVESAAEESPRDAASSSRKFHSMDKEALMAELRRIVDEKDVNAHKEVPAIRQAIFNLRQRDINRELEEWVDGGNAPEEFSATPDPVESEAKDLIAAFRELRTAYLEEEEKRLEANLQKKRAIVAEMEKIVEDADNVNQHFPRFQELQKEFKDIKDVTPSGEAEIWRQFQLVGEKFYDTLKINKELRDLNFKKNLEAKRRLITEAIALQAEEGVVEALRKLRQLHDEWRGIGPVVKELREEIWEEFREASAVIHRKHQEYFDRRKEEEKRNEEAKTAICEEIETIDLSTLTTFAAWEETAEKVKGLQAKWRTLGFASRKVNNEIYQRFRKSCDDFFEAKLKFITDARAGLQENYEKKLALCERAEALLANESGKGNLDEVIKLQAEWKTIGSVPRKLSNMVWQRFTKACREVFDRHKKASSERHNEEIANLEAKKVVIDSIKAIPLDIDRREGLNKVKELQAKWNEIGFVPFKQKDKLYAEYREACDAIYGAFSAGREQERRQNFEGQLENIKGDGRKIRSERERLMRVLEAKRQELKTFDNNLGFFNIKSASGNSMFKDMERKMSRIEADIKELQEKIAMIDEAGK